MSSRFAGERVLVTGAASGIGLATCERLVAEGTAVAGLDRNADGLAAAFAALEGSGRTVCTVVADVAERAAVDAAVAEAASRLGGLSGVVNVAGIGGWTGDVVQTDPADWDAVLAVDLTGVFHVCAATIPFLRESGGGSVVNVSSQYGLIGCIDSPAYCAAKAGLVGLTRAMALDHAEEGIRVNCLCPGPVETPLYAASEVQAGGLGERERERTRSRLPLGRIGTPAEIAGTIAFLLGTDAAYVTGAVLSVDGGWTAG
jgi:NAD(P)-dependent dehydrogenase (short-subunit alcohol dehydrogenase family)